MNLKDIYLKKEKIMDNRNLIDINTPETPSTSNLNKY